MDHNPAPVAGPDYPQHHPHGHTNYPDHPGQPEYPHTQEEYPHPQGQTDYPHPHGNTDFPHSQGQNWTGHPPLQGEYEDTNPQYLPPNPQRLYPQYDHHDNSGGAGYYGEDMMPRPGGYRYPERGEIEGANAEDTQYQDGGQSGPGSLGTVQYVDNGQPHLAHPDAQYQDHGDGPQDPVAHTMSREQFLYQSAPSDFNQDQLAYQHSNYPTYQYGNMDYHSNNMGYVPPEMAVTMPTHDVEPMEHRVAPPKASMNSEQEIGNHGNYGQQKEHIMSPRRQEAVALSNQNHDSDHYQVSYITCI